MAEIVVNFQHDRGLVYDADDYFRLRTEFRIVGNLIGVPVSHPRNINQQGLPVVLSSYELKLLFEKNAIRLSNRDAIFLQAPCTEQAQLYKSMIEKQKEEMRQPVIEKRIEAFRKHLPKIIEGKRKKLLKSGIKNEDINISPEQLVAEEMEKAKTAKFDVLVQIPTKYPFDCDQIKYRVFESLWNQGGFITVGDSFGCDFLLYPGDPMYFHASHMVHVLKKSSQKLDVKYLIRICRLSVVVNKLCVIAYIDETINDVHFETLEWEGTSNKGESV
uniref:tRNA-splicing endonuclease subunit Sen34 n=1 Tax=Anopheles atroparvus TaxID=41427 RepID=A0A182IQJ8_ANOAO